MFAWYTVKNGSIVKRRNTDPFEVTVCETPTMEIFQTLGCPVQLIGRLAEEVTRKVRPRTRSSLLA